jgi:hypothetical protein
MQRNNNNNRQNSRRRGPRRPRLLRNNINNAQFTISSTAASTRDTAVVRKKFIHFLRLPFTHADDTFAYSIRNVNVDPASLTYIEYFTEIARSYEEYKIGQLKLYASVGQGMDNDDRIKTLIATRVDVSGQPQVSDTHNLRGLLNAASTTIKSFTAANRTLIARVKPIMIASAPLEVRRYLPNQLEWFGLNDAQFLQHRWRGVTVCPLIPDVVDFERKYITLFVEVIVHVRGRIMEMPAVTNQPPLPIAETLLEGGSVDL